MVVSENNYVKATAYETLALFDGDFPFHIAREPSIVQIGTINMKKKGMTK